MRSMDVKHLFFLGEEHMDSGVSMLNFGMDRNLVKKT